eukprot:TRINITY_DN6908_c0_g1_i2.p1 TRINITY_DN6908_c0_g1~~TRINITY_DN6908_c0_g1_i2.p1  ORF type:complete len:539 (-),score=145.76 TRINITY_DN6908_c0_g1_i2:632-2248(-)
MEQPKDRSREIEDYDVVSMDDNNNRGNDQDGLPFHPSVAASRADTINVKKMDLGPPEIPHEEIIRGELLGKGSFGIVYSGICRGQPVAIKEPLKQHLTPVELESFQREVRTMSQIFHPNIVLLLGASKPNPLNKSEKLQICMEYCPTDVEKLLQEDRRLRKKRNQEGSSDTSGLLTMVEKLKIAKDAALGLNWLHGINSIVHGDLKSANLLVDSNRRVKVSDFGFSVVKAPNDPRKEPRPLGTPLYMAPEIMRNEGYNGFRADVYAFGLILWEILTSQRLFSEFDDWKPFKEAILGGHRPALPTDTPHLLGILIQRCWDAVPEKRPSFAEVIFRLDECIIDAAIVDEQARKFWKTHFLVPRQHLSEIVPWDQFKIVLAQDINVKTNVIEPAVNLLALEEENNLHQTEIHVTMNHFDKTVLTFGRFFSATEGPSVLNEIISLSAKDWFHGEIDRSFSHSICEAVTRHCLLCSCNRVISMPSYSSHRFLPAVLTLKSSVLLLSVSNSLDIRQIVQRCLEIFSSMYPSPHLDSAYHSSFSN